MCVCDILFPITLSKNVQNKMIRGEREKGGERRERMGTLAHSVEIRCCFVNRGWKDAYGEEYTFSQRIKKRLRERERMGHGNSEHAKETMQSEREYKHAQKYTHTETQTHTHTHPHTYIDCIHALIVWTLNHSKHKIMSSQDLLLYTCSEV